jgi:hypothetical protein
VTDEDKIAALTRLLWKAEGMLIALGRANLADELEAELARIKALPE